MAVPRLNREMALEAPHPAADGMGGFATAWVELGRLWVGVAPRTGRDVAGEGTALSTAAQRIVTRGAPVGSSMRPKPGQRLREGSRIFRIEAVMEADPAGRYLTCFAVEEQVI